MLARSLIRAEHREDDISVATPLALTAAERRRSRSRIVLPDGRDLGIALAPGTSLQIGDQLLCDNGERFAVHAAAEPLLRIDCADTLLLVRAAYHLGNRHVAVDIRSDHLAIEPDAVLRDMLVRLGVSVSATVTPFEPETGAYGGGHRHGHDATFGEDHQLAQSLFALHATRTHDD